MVLFSFMSFNALYAIAGGIAAGVCVGFGIGCVISRIRNKKLCKELNQQKNAQKKLYKAKKKETSKANKSIEEFPADINDFNMLIDPNETIQFIDSSPSTWEEHKLMLIVRTDLQMSKFKTAAHCGHATLGAYNLALKFTPGAVKLWSKIGQAKITLKANSEEEINKLAIQAKNAGIPFYVARNSSASDPKIPDGTPTVLAIGPVSKSRVDLITGNLKLLT